MTSEEQKVTPLETIRGEINSIMRHAETTALNGETVKMTVGGGKAYDLFIILNRTKDRYVYIDVKLSLFAYSEAKRENGEACDFPSPEVIDLRQEQVSHTMAALEVISRQASELLASGLWTLENVIESWQGTHVYHRGSCPGLPPIEGCIQEASGALDAVARKLRERLPMLNRLIVREEENIGRASWL
jgi:hypothetical protein